MPELFVSHQGKKYFSASLKSERFTIGRSQENDLVLTGEGVARRHALIEKRGQAYWLRGDGLNGTSLNGEILVGSRELKSRDRIGIDRWSIEFCDRRLQPAVIARMSDAVTKIIEAPDAPAASASDVAPNFLIVRNPYGGHSRHAVRKEALVLGSSPESDVVIVDDCVSRRHAVLAFAGRGFNVTDQGSTNGTFIDGVRIREAFLSGEREISVGRSHVRVCFARPADGAAGEIFQGGFFGIVGESPAMLELFALMSKVAPRDMTALILGPTGSGKERVAGVLHELSQRHDRPFVALNCGAIAPGLVESELFGHEKGAFTGALERRAGAFEQAHTGTLFLDEVGELPLAAQARLLRAIEYGRVRRVGAERETEVDVRIIAATHRNLAELVRRGEFREDLFYRLYVLPVTIPPLKERGDDAVLLARHFLKLGGGLGIEFDDGALARIRAHEWPGNVRELRNAVLRAATLGEAEKIRAHDLILMNPPAFYGGVVKDRPLLTPEEEEEAERFRSALKQTGGDKGKAARVLQMGRSTFFRRIKVLGI